MSGKLKILLLIGLQLVVSIMCVSMWVKLNLHTLIRLLEQHHTKLGIQIGTLASSTGCNTM